jgi:hypothetical protein
MIFLSDILLRGVSVAKKQKTDLSLSARMDELERMMFRLKLQYDKHFSGIERIEPLREREDLRRVVREMMQEHITNTAQKYRFTSLKSRFNSLDMYISRNLFQIERGTHPKMKFRLAMMDRHKRDAALRSQKLAERRKNFESKKEDQAMRRVYDSFVEAQKECGQKSSVSYEAMKDTLKKQAQAIKSRHKCDNVRFKVSVEDGKVRMKALPTKKGNVEG